ncbi:MAG TPA: helix-turn-helix domain-containing protein [Chloroflexota bacterium]
MAQEIVSPGISSPQRVPGYLSVRAAAEWLGMGERGVRHLIERNKVVSARLGRMHFISTRDVSAYRTERRLRKLRAMRRLRRAA